MDCLVPEIALDGILIVPTTGLFETRFDTRKGISLSWRGLMSAEKGMMLS